MRFDRFVDRAGRRGTHGRPVARVGAGGRGRPQQSEPRGLRMATRWRAAAPRGGGSSGPSSSSSGSGSCIPTRAAAVRRVRAARPPRGWTSDPSDTMHRAHPFTQSQFDARGSCGAAADQRRVDRPRGAAERVRRQGVRQPERDQLESRIGGSRVWRSRTACGSGIQPSARRSERDGKRCPHRTSPIHWQSDHDGGSLTRIIRATSTIRSIRTITVRTTHHYGYWSPYGYGYGLGYFYDPFLFGGARVLRVYYRFLWLRAAATGWRRRRIVCRSTPAHGSLRLKVKPRECAGLHRRLLRRRRSTASTARSSVSTSRPVRTRLNLKAEGYETDAVRRDAEAWRNGHLQGRDEAPVSALSALPHRRNFGPLRRNRRGPFAVRSRLAGGHLRRPAREPAHLFGSERDCFCWPLARLLPAVARSGPLSRILWVMGPLLKGAGAVAFVLDHFLRGSPRVVSALRRQRRSARAPDA